VTVECDDVGLRMTRFVRLRWHSFDNKTREVVRCTIIVTFVRDPEDEKLRLHSTIRVSG
jgi:hypothetical protein